MAENLSDESSQDAVWMLYNCIGLDSLDFLEMSTSCRSSDFGRSLATTGLGCAVSIDSNASHTLFRDAPTVPMMESLKCFDKDLIQSAYSHSNGGACQRSQGCDPS